MQGIELAAIAFVAFAMGSGAMYALLGVRSKGEVFEENKHLRQRVLEAEEDLFSANTSMSNSYSEHRCTRRELNAAMRSRDRYRAIAVTHEIILPTSPRGSSKVKQIWECRKYSSLPMENLEDFLRDLEPWAGQHVEVEVRVIIGTHTGWHNILKDHWEGQGKAPPTQTFTYEGTPARIIRSLETRLKDPAFGMTRPIESRGPPGNRVWRDTEAPLLLEVTLRAKTPSLPVPEIVTQIVEVAVVETRVEKFEVIKLVSLTPATGSPGDDSDLHLLVEGIIEAREAAQGKSPDRLSQEIKEAAEATEASR